MSKSGQTRGSGMKAAAEEAAEQVAKMDEPVDIPDKDLDKLRRFRSPGFSRIRAEWSFEERTVVDMVTGTVERRIREVFADAFVIMDDLYAIVREPELDTEGRPRRGVDERPIYRRTANGDVVENWARLSVRQQEDFLFRITSRIYAWEQSAADAWAEAMLAKAMWEERFAIGYDAPMSGTIEDRTSRAKMDATDERYMAIVMSLYSRKADAMVRSMSLLAQRLKDVMGS
jgi:hypothetical protein